MTVLHVDYLLLLLLETEEYLMKTLMTNNSVSKQYVHQNLVGQNKTTQF